MDANISEHRDLGKNPSAESNQQLNKIVQKYRRLITLKDPSNNEQREIEEILELCIYDTELNDLLSCTDEKIAMEIGLIDEYSTYINKSKMHNLSNNYEHKNIVNIIVLP